MSARMREIAERAETEASYRRAVGDSLTQAEVDRAFLLARVEALEAALREVEMEADAWFEDRDEGLAGLVITNALLFARAILSPDSEP